VVELVKLKKLPFYHICAAGGHFWALSALREGEMELLRDIIGLRVGREVSKPTTLSH